jgi:hypothetical protein
LLGATGWQTATPATQADERVDHVPARAYGLKCAIPLLLLPLAFLGWRAWRPAEPVPVVERPEASAAGPGRTLPAVALVTRTLSCGQTIDVAPDGVESKLIAFSYTDNVGDAPSNRRLAQARADNTLAAIAASGIAASRLEAEGYGEQHPVASNDTAEGRQRNRRIDLRVTLKESVPRADIPVGLNRREQRSSSFVSADAIRGA